MQGLLPRNPQDTQVNPTRKGSREGARQTQRGSDQREEGTGSPGGGHRAEAEGASGTEARQAPQQRPGVSGRVHVRGRPRRGLEKRSPWGQSWIGASLSPGCRLQASPGMAQTLTPTVSRAQPGGASLWLLHRPEEKRGVLGLGPPSCPQEAGQQPLSALLLRVWLDGGNRPSGQEQKASVPRQLPADQEGRSAGTGAQGPAPSALAQEGSLRVGALGSQSPDPQPQYVSKSTGGAAPASGAA